MSVHQKRRLCKLEAATSALPDCQVICRATEETAEDALKRHFGYGPRPRNVVVLNEIAWAL